MAGKDAELFFIYLCEITRIFEAARGRDAVILREVSSSRDFDMLSRKMFRYSLKLRPNRLLKVRQR